MNLVLIIVLVLAETAAVFFAGFTTAEKRYAAAEATRVTENVAIAQRTKVIVQERIKWRTADAKANATNAAAVSAEIAAHPTPLTCPAISTGLLNSYIQRANAAGRVLATATLSDQPAGPSHR